MQLTKFEHSCVLLDDGTTKILFDPGLYSNIPELKLDAVVITHVHLDHLDPEKIKPLIASNPGVRVITNTQSKEELEKHGIQSELLEQTQKTTVNTMTLEGFGNNHAIMHPDLPKFQNTAYLINDKILHPGDALLVVDRPVETLLLPVAAPWSKVEETLDYIAAVKPKNCVPIHDGFITDGGAFHRFAKMWCEKIGANFIEIESNKQYEI